VDGTYSMCVGNTKCRKNVIQETCREETSWEMGTSVVGYGNIKMDL
jgi:hypothetical protein